MSNNDQQLVDHLYNIIFVQQLRFNHFNSVGQSNNSVWNKHSDEKKILDTMVENYKNYYKTKVEDLKTKLYDLKEVNVNSYLTYDKEYYVNDYNQRIEELNKYLVELDTKTLDHISKDKLSFLSEELELQFPDYLVDPVLLGKLC
jgi:hypothetical protein